MNNSPTQNRRWIGRWFVVVGAIHLVFGFVIYSSAWNAMLAEGLFASADDLSLRATAYWFMAFAPALMMLGGLTDHIEASGTGFPRWFPVSLALTLAVLLFLMPANGAWTLVPPLIALFARRGRAVPLA